MDPLLKIFKALICFFVLSVYSNALAQENDMEPSQTEQWKPVPAKVTPGMNHTPPSDAVILFDGKDLSKWQSAGGGSAQWNVNGDHFVVKPGTGNIKTNKKFGDIQLHIEWRSPEEINGKGQGRGNSGIFLQQRYELQVLDSYNNETYSNGMAGSIYKQHIPMVNAAREPGAWQVYDVIFKAPRFDQDGSLESPARITVFWNGMLIQNDVEIKGSTTYTGLPSYESHDSKQALVLQDHSDLVSYRNIWIREIDLDEN